MLPYATTLRSGRLDHADDDADTLVPCVNSIDEDLADVGIAGDLRGGSVGKKKKAESQTGASHHGYDHVANFGRIASVPSLTAISVV
jgi:hypothetical protein